MGKFSNNSQISFPINEEIRFCKEVRIIGEGIESRIVSLDDARKLAESMELDAVLINHKASPPIVRICNYSKLIYEMKIAAKKNKNSAKPLKEIQLSVNITTHDLETKANHARKFLANGSKVKVVLSMKGRELLRREENKRSILEFIVMLEDDASLESQIKDEGNRTIAILKPKKK